MALGGVFFVGPFILDTIEDLRTQIRRVHAILGSIWSNFPQIVTSIRVHFDYESHFEVFRRFVTPLAAGHHSGNSFS